MRAGTSETDTMTAQLSRPQSRRLSFALALVAALTPAAVRADLQFAVTISNPQALNGNSFGAGGPYALDFTLAGGANTNTATVGSFNLGGGSANSSTISTTGGASGTIAPTGGVTVTDDASINPSAGAFNDFNEVFTPGSSSVTFDVDLTTSFVSGTPDRFTVSILDQSGNPIPTTDTGNSDEYALVGVDITGPSMTVGSVSTYSAGAGAGAIIASVAPLGPPAVPEPTSLVLTCLGIGTLLGASRLRRDRHGLPGRRRPADMANAGLPVRVDYASEH